jgi:V/A-type H+-transporting ATPase subunit E
MNGKEAIIEKILSDARGIANSTLEEAGAFGKQTIETAENDVRIYREKNMRESYDERKEIIRRKMTVANLEVKKEILAKKQEMMTAAFDEAIKLIKDDGKSYLNLLRGMIEKASDGDKVVFSERDKNLVGEKWLAGVADDLNKKLVFGGYGDFCGGIIVESDGSDKNMSLEVELKSVREEYEPEIAAVLFGE